MAHQNKNHQYIENIAPLNAPNCHGTAIVAGTLVTHQHILDAKADEIAFQHDPQHALAAAVRRIKVEQATVCAINDPMAGAPAWFGRAMEAALKPIHDRLDAVETRLGAVETQLGATQANAVIRSRNKDNQSNLQALVKEVALPDGQVAGPHLGALGDVLPDGMFPATIDRFSSLTHAQITTLATWYGIDGTAIPAMDADNLAQRRGALRTWVGL